MSKLEELAYPAGTEPDIAKAQLKEAYEIFQQNAFDGDSVPTMCDLHDIFSSSTEPSEVVTADHNCLGCNFADSITLIDSFLETHDSQSSVQTSHTIAIMLFYLLVERMDMLLKLIKLNEEIYNEDFKILMEVRKWANFIKHPKAFVLTHHPVFTFEGHKHNSTARAEAKPCVDYTFVQKYYSNDEKNTDLFNELENKADVLVIYPSLPKIAAKMCEAMNNLIALLRDNSVFRRILKQKSTFREYWLPVPAKPELAAAASEE